MTQKIDLKATGILVAALVSWSLAPVFLKYFTTYIDAWTTNGLRYSTAAVPFILYFILRKRGYPTRHLWKSALIVSAINAVGQVFWALAPYYIDPGLMAFIVRLSTLWAVLGSFILFHEERPVIRQPLFWVGLALSLGGFAGLIFGGNQEFRGAGAIGVTLSFVCSIFWAAYQISVRKFLKDVDSPTAFGMVAILTSAFLLPLMFTVGRPEQALQLPIHVTGLVILSGLICISMAHVLFYMAIQRLGVAISTSTNIAGAFITALLSWFIFREVLTPFQWISGGIIVFGGILLVRTQVYLVGRS